MLGDVGCPVEELEEQGRLDSVRSCQRRLDRVRDCLASGLSAILQVSKFWAALRALAFKYHLSLKGTHAHCAMRRRTGMLTDAGRRRMSERRENADGTRWRVLVGRDARARV